MKSSLSVNDKISNVSTIKIAEFRKHIRKTKPHRHNKYLELVFFMEGDGTHTIDLQKINIQPNILFVVRKEQVHFWDITTEPSGYVILIKNSFIEESFDASLKKLIYKISAHTCLFPKDSEATQQLFHLMVREYNTHSIDNKEVLEGLFKALLSKLLQAETKSNVVHDNLYDNYIKLLSEKNNGFTKVEEYANSLHTSPQNLNSICRKECDKSASEVLSDATISEAQRMLLYTDMNINEISYALHFKDNSHFTKFFKRHTAQTPKNYRNCYK